MTHCSFLFGAAVVALKVQAHEGAGLESTVQGLPYCVMGATPQAMNQHIPTAAQPILSRAAAVHRATLGVCLSSQMLVNLPNQEGTKICQAQVPGLPFLAIPSWQTLSLLQKHRRSVQVRPSIFKGSQKDSRGVLFLY